ncbi:allophanate hydrolase subunit 1 [uncultured Roseobacter sp.]|uniref:5-oxoprolinase subunit B family protein n=1 Tax=uncultured Roseobacter sp. TaxID=114847 RepID=UPI00262FE01A|nr:allophanate hydrolase subunit 1 [uncultured Roseobacter sp.]
MTDYPIIRTVGLSGLLVTFAGTMSEAANKASVAFRAAVDAEDWPEVSETAMSLVSVFVITDLVAHDADRMIKRLETLLASRDWLAAPLPEGRTLWHIPTVYGTDLAPQLEEAAAAAGVDPDEAIRQISSTRVRVLTIGFAPGQPYLGELAENWNIPRQKDLSLNVPAGALVVAIRQLVIFTNTTPTGWRHIGQTAFRTFDMSGTEPFALSPGDEIVFPAVPRAELEALRGKYPDGFGAAEREALA